MSFFTSSLEGIHSNMNITDQIESTGGITDPVTGTKERNGVMLPSTSMAPSGEFSVVESPALNTMMNLDQTASTPVVSTSPISASCRMNPGISSEKHLMFAADVGVSNWASNDRSTQINSQQTESQNHRKLRIPSNHTNVSQGRMSVSHSGVQLSSHHLHTSTPIMVSTPISTKQLQVDLNSVPQTGLDVFGEQLGSAVPLWHNESAILLPSGGDIPPDAHLISRRQHHSERNHLAPNSPLLSNLETGLVASGQLVMNSTVPEVTRYLQANLNPLASEFGPARSFHTERRLSKNQGSHVDVGADTGSGSTAAVGTAEVSISVGKGNILPQASRGRDTADQELNSVKNAEKLASVEENGLTAVEHAKREAESFTMSQLSNKRKKDYLANRGDGTKKQRISTKISGTDEEEERGMNGNLPEHISHRKYQKRLQKNRDSAFVSRIRRREYTRLLEQSLTRVEKEKDWAIQGFREMKRRFERVTAELNEIKDTTVSNLNSLKESLVKTETIDDDKSSKSRQQSRTSAAVTTMFMFALIFGVFLPDMVFHDRAHSSNWGYDNYMDSEKRYGSFPFVEMKSSIIPRERIFGRVWKLSEKNELDHSESQQVIAISNLKDWDSFVNSLEQDISNIIGVEKSSALTNLVQRQPIKLSSDEIKTLCTYVRNKFRVENMNELEQKRYTRDLAISLESQLVKMSCNLTDRLTNSATLKVA